MIAAKPEEYNELWSYISWLNGGNVLLNRQGEALSNKYPSAGAVADYVKSGGVYVDYCGWPMYYGGTRDLGTDPGRFNEFLRLVGADPSYCLGFKPSGKAPCNPFSVYPFARGWLTTAWWIEDQRGVIVADPEAPFGSCTVAHTGQRARVYSVVGVKGGRGWYFYGFGTTDGPSVDPQVYARFIKQMVGIDTGAGGTGNDSPVSTREKPCNPDDCKSEPILRYGDYEPCVGWVQRRLKQLGYSAGPTDCKFGSLTQAAVSKFQKDKGIVTGGVVDAATWAALKGATVVMPITDQERCRRAGGTWDASRNICVTPKQATWRADECRMLGRTWDPVTDECVGPTWPEEVKKYLPYAGIVALAGVGIYLLVRR